MATNDNEGKETKFKVVDRRRFNDDGTAREGPDVAPDKPARNDPVSPPSPPSAASSAAAAATSPGPSAAGGPGAPGGAGNGAPAKNAPAAGGDKGATPADEAPNGLTFSIFIQSLAQQALMQLGMIPWPHGQRELHLEQARDTIDILQLLKAKTRNNLNAEETQLIDTVLYELKMSWVEVQQAIARSKGSPLPKPPGR